MEHDEVEKKAFDKIINCLTDHNLRLTIDYTIEHYNDGCFLIKFCPRRSFMLDIEYFYEMVPNITIFKVGYSGGVMKLNIKVRLRR